MSDGFTLTELLVVIAIIVVLVAVSFPVSRSMRESSQMVTCTSNLRMLQVQTMIYVSDNNTFPPTVNPQNNYALELATNGYLGLSGDDKKQRTDSWKDLSKRRQPFVLWCPCAEACESRAPYGNLATYGMNVNVGGTGGWRNPSISALRTSQVETPGRTALYMDGCFKPGKGYDVRVGEAGFMPTPMHPASRYKTTNKPAGSVNVVFVDGHVELRTIGTIPSDFTHPFWAAKVAP